MKDLIAAISEHDQIMIHLTDAGTIFCSEIRFYDEKYELWNDGKLIFIFRQEMLTDADLKLIKDTLVNQKYSCNGKCELRDSCKHASEHEQHDTCHVACCQALNARCIQVKNND